MSWPHPWLFAAWLVLVAAFILVTGTQLPPTVASHFGASGHADAFMSRASYLVVMGVAGAALPAIVVAAQHWIMRQRPQRINLPNRDYWLAPERREATTRMIAEHMMLFGFGLSLLLSFAHWEVVQANLRQPPQLDNVRFIVAIGVFIVATGWWVYRLYVRFRKP